MRRIIRSAPLLVNLSAGPTSNLGINRCTVGQTPTAEFHTPYDIIRRTLIVLFACEEHHYHSYAWDGAQAAFVFNLQEKDHDQTSHHTRQQNHRETRQK